MTTMRDVAQLAGVSAKTVSRALRGDDYVSDDVRARVLAAVGELQYVPNSLAVSFRTGRDLAIGVAVPDLANPFFAEIVQAVETVVRERSAAVIVSSTSEDGTRERAVLEALLRRQVMGLIAVPVAPDQAYLRSWQNRVPMVFVDRTPGRLTADAVLQDDAGGATQAAHHLLDRGHRRIALVAEELDAATVAVRREAFAAVLAGAGVTATDVVATLDRLTPGGVDEAMRSLRDRPEPPTALFAATLRSAMAVIPSFGRIGWRPAFVSFGDFPMAEALDPPVCVIDQDPAAMGRAAAQRLFHRIDTPRARLRRQIVTPVRLIERSSCGAG